MIQKGGRSAFCQAQLQLQLNLCLKLKFSLNTPTHPPPNRKDSYHASREHKIERKKESLFLHSEGTSYKQAEAEVMPSSSFKGVKKVSTVFLKRIFKGVSRMFQLSFILRFCCCMDLIAATREKGGLVLSVLL